MRHAEQRRLPRDVRETGALEGEAHDTGGWGGASNAIDGENEVVQALKCYRIPLAAFWMSASLKSGPAFAASPCPLPRPLPLRPDRRLRPALS